MTQDQLHPYDAGWNVEHCTGEKGLGWYVCNPEGQHVAGPFTTRNEALQTRDTLYGRED